LQTLLAGSAIALAALATPGLECPRFIRGDANQDGRVDIADPIRTLQYLFEAGTSIGCDDAADADDGGSINITDPIYTLLFLFSSGRPPPAPGPAECGSDDTPDGLECLDGGGCKPSAVPADFSGFLRFEYFQEPALGFCPEIGKVFRAVIQREDPGYRLEMSVLEEGDPAQGGCIEVISAECAVEVPLPPRTLTAEEVAAVKDAFSSVPVFHQIDPICFCVAIDPCVVPNFLWDGSLASAFECHMPRVTSGVARSIVLLLEGLRA
jgi:hypothetical protein